MTIQWTFLPNFVLIQTVVSEIKMEMQKSMDNNMNNDDMMMTLLTIPYLSHHITILESHWPPLFQENW